MNGGAKKRFTSSQPPQALQMPTKAEKSADKKLMKAKSFAKCTLSLHFLVLYSWTTMPLRTHFFARQPYTDRDIKFKCQHHTNCAEGMKRKTKINFDKKLTTNHQLAKKCMMPGETVSAQVGWGTRLDAKRGRSAQSHSSHDELGCHHVCAYHSLQHSIALDFNCCKAPPFFPNKLCYECYFLIKTS